MKTNPFARILASVVVAFAMIAAAGASTVAIAAPGPLFKAESVMVHGYANATAAQTFATTSYADLAAATVSVPKAAARSYSQTSAPGTPTRTPTLIIQWSASVTKATSTDGTCAIYVNGAIVAGTARVGTFASGTSSIGGFYEVARSSDAAQTVKLQCKSGDTAVFTVNFANIRVSEVVR